ncbi:MAG TPA: hypothetical protein VJ550_07020 [Geomonas sp.]|nr:hypothetical protein [Geomonas sp.]
MKWRKPAASTGKVLCLLPAVLLLVVAAVLAASPLLAAPVPVRFSEGMTHGFLVLTDTKGTRLASGDFLQLHQGRDVKARILFQFKDGSVRDETAVFSQQKVFELQSYHLIQKGPSFKDDMDIHLERSGKYRVTVKPHKGEEKVLDGKLDLPPDVYNGMLPTIGKNLEKGHGATVHIVAFTPTPRVIELEMVPDGEEKVHVGDLPKTASHYILKPKLGLLLKIPAAILGRTPPDSHLWTIFAEVPAFVKLEGPLATDGPIWRVELTSPVWPK